jgi:hypothetical protein
LPAADEISSIRWDIKPATPGSLENFRALSSFSKDHNLTPLQSDLRLIAQTEAIEQSSATGV